MDLVTLNMKDGSKREVELVARFRLDGFDSEYILYKLDDVCYGAKFKEEGGMTKLSCDLSDIEKKALSRFYEALNKGGEK